MGRGKVTDTVDHNPPLRPACGARIKYPCLVVDPPFCPLYPNLSRLSATATPTRYASPTFARTASRPSTTSPLSPLAAYHTPGDLRLTEGGG